MCVGVQSLICVYVRPVVSDSLQPHGLQPTSCLCPCFSGNSTGVGCCVLQGIFPTQGSNT